MTTTTGRPTSHAAHSVLTGSWRDHALCREVDPELFFPGQGKAGTKQARKAKKVCADCPVMMRCRRWAFETRQDAGVWGGMTESERRVVHGRKPGRVRPAAGSSVAKELLATRREEFLELKRQGLSSHEVARALETNAQTVHNIQRLIDAEAAGMTMGVTA